MMGGIIAPNNGKPGDRIGRAPPRLLSATRRKFRFCRIGKLGREAEPVRWLTAAWTSRCMPGLPWLPRSGSTVKPVLGVSGKLRFGKLMTG